MRALTSSKAKTTPYSSFSSHSSTRPGHRHQKVLPFSVKASSEKGGSSTTTTTKEPRQPWDVQRFVRTVLFFNPPPSPGQVLRSAIELPFKTVSKVLGSQANTTLEKTAATTVPLRVTMPSSAATQASGSNKSVFLLSTAADATQLKAAAALLAQGKQVRAFVPDINTAQASFKELSAAPGAKLELAPMAAITSAAAAAAAPIVITTSQNKLSELRTLLKSLVTNKILPKTTGEAVYTPDGLSPAQQWGAVDDVVMGGVSRSGFSVRPNAGENGGLAGVFAGNVTTANNGGFASTRTRNLTPPLNLSSYDGMDLRVFGDGQRYKFVVKTDAGWDGIGYTASFDTQPGVWQTVKVPFESLVPVFRARTVQDAPKFDTSQVTSLQLMLSKFEYDGRLNPTFREGQFELPVERIGAYLESPDKARVAVVVEDESNVAAVEAMLKDEFSEMPFAVVSAGKLDTELANKMI